MRASRPLLILAFLGLVAPASAGDAAPAAGTMPELIERAVEAGELDRATADLHLVAALAGEPVPPRYRGTRPWDGTLVLLELEDRAGEMPPGPERRELRTALHPIAGAGTDACGPSMGPTTHTTNSTHFYIEYNDAEVSAGLGIEAFRASLDAAWNTEVGAFGWPAPPVYGPNPAPANRYPVRIQNLGPAIYGFVSSSGTHAGRVDDNPNTPWNEGDAHASCMVLNSDYSFFPGTPQAAMDATVGHEFNHSIQFGYGALNGPNVPDQVFVEGGATWMEDEVFDGSNDNYNYLWPNLADDMGQHEGSPYRYWIVFRAMTERYGTGVGGGGERIMQRFWELTSKNQADTLEALDRALQAEGRGLPDAFHEAAVAIRYSKACGGGYAQPFCFEEGAGYTGLKGVPPAHGAIGGIGTSTSGQLPDNHSANFITMPTGLGAFQVILVNDSPQAGRFTGSVVCDTGSALRVTPFKGIAAGGGRIYVRSADTQGCAAASIVVVNVSQTAANPTSSSNRPYTLHVTPPPSPSKTKVKGRPAGNQVKIRGRVRPPQPGGEVKLKLQRRVGGKWKRADSETVVLKNGKRIKAKMRSKNASICRIRATFLGDDDHLPSKAKKRFRC